MTNVIALVILIGIAVQLGWLSVRARRLKNGILKWSGVSLAGLLAAVFALEGMIIIAGLYKMQSRSATIPDIKVAGTPEQVERGKAIADTFCAGCHKGTLTGGGDLANDLPMPLGSFV